jgi:hypothetical protein
MLLVELNAGELIYDAIGTCRKYSLDTKSRKEFTKGRE